MGHAGQPWEASRGLVLGKGLGEGTRKPASPGHELGKPE